MCLGRNLKDLLQLRRKRRCGLHFVLQARNLRCFGSCDLESKTLDDLFSVSFSGGCIQLKMFLFSIVFKEERPGFMFFGQQEGWQRKLSRVHLQLEIFIERSTLTSKAFCKEVKNVRHT